MQINLYTMQQIQQIYQSQLMVSSVQGDNRMKEAVREVPRFSDQLTRATEPITRKVTQPVESVIDEKAMIPAMFYRAMDGGYGSYTHRIHGKLGNQNSVASTFKSVHSNGDRVRRASSSYAATMDMAGGPVDYVDYSHGIAFDAFY